MFRKALVAAITVSAMFLFACSSSDVRNGTDPSLDPSGDPNADPTAQTDQAPALGTAAELANSDPAAAPDSLAAAASPDAAAAAPDSTAAATANPAGTPPVTAQADPVPAAAGPSVAAAAEPTGGATSGDGQFSEYRVQGGDTLMKIAFEVYGDLYQWKKIYEDNKGVIKNPNAISSGTVLKVEQAAGQAHVDRNGDRYQIQPGDTLGTISDNIYGTKEKWRKIWQNNKQLIHDPNKIFAGFTLYYSMTPKEREEAEQLKSNRGTPAPTNNAPAPIAKEQPQVPVAAPGVPAAQRTPASTPAPMGPGPSAAGK